MLESLHASIIEIFESVTILVTDFPIFILYFIKKLILPQIYGVVHAVHLWKQSVQLFPSKFGYEEMQLQVTPSILLGSLQNTINYII